LILRGSPAIQFWDLKMPKIVLADCSGVGDAVIARASLLETCNAVACLSYRHFRSNGALIWHKSARSTSLCSPSLRHRLDAGGLHVRFWHKADILIVGANVRFWHKVDITALGDKADITHCARRFL